MHFAKKTVCVTSTTSQGRLSLAPASGLSQVFPLQRKPFPNSPHTDCLHDLEHVPKWTCAEFSMVPTVPMECQFFVGFVLVEEGRSFVFVATQWLMSRSVLSVPCSLFCPTAFLSHSSLNPGPSPFCLSSTALGRMEDST